jgi:hypothetical protein
VAGGFLQAVPLAVYYVKLFLLGSTPRSVYGIKYGLRNVAWGTAFPEITLLVVITLGYSIIAPIINGLACATFFLFYMMYKYLFLWVYQQPSTSDTGGLFFPKAIGHIFVGMYVQQVCLAALFFLAQNQDKKPGAIPEAVLMIVLIVITVRVCRLLLWNLFSLLLRLFIQAFYHLIINNSYGPLLHALPLSLAERTYTAPAITRETTEAASPLNQQPSIPLNSTSAGESEHESKAKDKTPAALDASAEAKMKVDYGFAHPAASRPQRTVWLPKDTLGIAEEEVAACKELGVHASSKRAVMKNGKVDIIGPPPDLILEEFIPEEELIPDE